MQWASSDSASRLLLATAAGAAVHPGDVNGAELLELGFRHGLLGLLAGSGLKELAEPVVHHHLAQRLRQRAMLSHLRRILTSLHDSGIKATVLKGPYVAEDYENPNFRTFTDLDLLVPEESLESTLAVLAADEAVRSIPPKGPKGDKRDIPLHDPSGAVFNLDLHWDLFSYSQLMGAAEGGTAWAWQHARFDPAHPLGPLWHHPPGPRISFLCTHALFDHRFRLILFRDLVELARAGVDWEEVIDFAEEFQLRSSTYVSLLIARRLLGAQVPESTLKKLRPRGPLIRLVEFLLPRIDFARFDGHKPHLLNLALVLLHDQPRKQLVLALRAPLAVPGWTRRVAWRPLSRRGSPPRNDHRPRIMVLVNTSRRRGAEVFGERLAIGLRGLGWRIDLTSLTRGSNDVEIGGRAASRRSPDDLGPLNLDVVMGLRRQLKAQRPTIIFANGSSTLKYSVAASFGLRSRPLLVYCSIGEPRYWSRNARQRIGQAALLSRVDHVVAVSDESRRQLIEFLGISHEKVSVAYTGVPASFFEIERSPRGERLRLLYLGNLSKEKDPYSALGILQLVQGRGLPVALRFVGGGPLLQDLQQHVWDRGIEAVEFTGSVEDVRPHLAWCDLLVLTSETEGLPGAVIEAAAAGVPTAAFDVGGVAETIVDGETGVVIPDRDLELFADRIASLSEDPEVLSEMGRRARQFAGERFRLEQATLRYHDVLRSLLRAGAVTTRPSQPASTAT